MEGDKVRFPKFAKRLEKVCDDHPDCPPLHKGRQVWIREQLAKEMLFVSIEGIRKWLAGETRPRDEKAAILGKVFGIDPHWLRTGVRVVSPLGDHDQDLPNVGTSAPPLQVGLRPGVTVEIRGIPFDLTRGEASKLGNVLLALSEVDR